MFQFYFKVIESEIGKGGYGVVYRGVTKINYQTVKVALKKGHEAVEHQREIDFLREQTNKGTMDSIFLVQLIDIVTIDSSK